MAGPSHVKPLDENSLHTMETPDTVQENENVTRYYVIPPLILPLISRFFDVWSENVNMLPDLYKCIFNENNDIDRAQSIVHQIISDYSTLDELRSRMFSFGIRGNYFWGPANRGPFLPQAGQSEEASMVAFEIDSVSIIGREHFQNLISIFIRLIDYITLDLEQTNPVLRFFFGIELYELMMTTFSMYETPLLNLNLWEERYMTRNEYLRLIMVRKNSIACKSFGMSRKTQGDPEDL